MSAANENLIRLTIWAEKRRLEVVKSSASVFDRQNVVSIRVKGTTEWLLSRRSEDSVDTAAAYVINSLHWLGVKVPK